MNRSVLGLGASVSLVVAVACGGSSPVAPGADGGADASSTNDAAPVSDGGSTSDADAAPEGDATGTADGAADAGVHDDAATVEDAASSGANVGADAGPLPDGSLPCTATPGANTVFMYGTEGVSIGADGGAATVTMPDGFEFAARVSLTTAFSGSASETRIVRVTDPALGMTAAAGNPNGSLTPEITLTAGPRVVQYSVQESFGGDELSTRYAYGVVDVCGDTTTDAVLAGFPALTAVNIEVDGLDRLPTETGMPLTLALWTPDLTFAAMNSVPFPDAGTSVVVPLMAPTGVSLVPVFTGMVDYPVRGATVTLTGDAQISVPPQFTISGTITSPDTSAIGSGFLQCKSQPAPTEANPYSLFDSYLGHVTGGAPYAYSVGVTQGASCALAPLVDLNTQEGPPFSASYLTTSSSITASANATQSFTFPSAGALVPFGLTVVDARGKTLDSVTASMHSTSLAPSTLAGYTFGVTATTGTGNGVAPMVVPGTYSIQVQTYE